MSASRRDFVVQAAALSLGPAHGRAQVDSPHLPARARPLPLKAVRLLPSDYRTAVETDNAYLLHLQPDRLLHNFRKYAGLAPKGEIYGGWESDTIAGHTLGHYLSAIVLMYDQTGDPEHHRRADYIVSELALCQARRGTGYVGGLQRKRKSGEVVDGEEIFPEIMRGDIRSTGFDLNGAWSPLYTVHKLYAGLLNIHERWRNPRALAVLLGLSAYFDRVFAALDDAQMQQVLACEYGGLNESFAELHARTGDRRWLVLAERLYDRKILDPLADGRDELANLHANTQIPKLIGLARLYEITGKPHYRAAALTFYHAVTNQHTYVIGGNADREYFSAPATIAGHITEQTCEHCNSYNMLKLARRLYHNDVQGSYFDDYERTHLNHVMAAQNPKGGFTYMTPLISGSAREFSSQDGDFWCCVGTGMESHAKHGDSIVWEDREGAGRALLINLYIPCEFAWSSRRARMTLETHYPYEKRSRLTLTALGRPGRFAIALRLPEWARGQARISVNGRTAALRVARGYAVVDRRWAAGDVLEIVLPLDLRLEVAAGDANTVAVLRGPMVLAADLGEAKTDWTGVPPALVGEAPLADFEPAGSQIATYTSGAALRPAALTFRPFYRQYERRSAVYFKRFSEAGWRLQAVAYTAEQARLREVASQIVDVMHLGEMQPERDHRLTSEVSYPLTYRGRNGRDARSGGYFEFSLKSTDAPLALRVTYWGDERPRDFDILVDNVKVATQHLGPGTPDFFEASYALAPALSAGRPEVKVRFVPHQGSAVGPVYTVALVRIDPPSSFSSKVTRVEPP